VYYCFFLINIVEASCFSNRRAVQPDPRIDDTATIRIDPATRRKHPRDAQCLDALLKELLADQNGIFQQPMFSGFLGSSATKLVLSEKKLPRTKGGFSGKYAGFDGIWIFRDKIFLNRLDFTTGSRDYLVSVILHETIHDFITWCAMSFHFKKNGVDTVFLKQHFSGHLDWLTADTFPGEAQEHIMMSEDFAGIMVRSLYPYTNPQSDSILREKIAESLTWVGLSETPGFKKLTLDTCYMLNVDVWARNVDASEGIEAGCKNCDSTDFGFFRALRLIPVCK
jgi:hypothetical protein